MPGIAQQLDSTNLPIVIINTNGQSIVDDPKIMADMGIIWNGNGMNHMTDPMNHYNGRIGIETRGQSSQMFPMKSYGIELWDTGANSINAPLFGMPAESDWILYAPFNEKTLTHNCLAYTLSREMGHWASHGRYVEVVLNGQYIGIYVFMEKIKRDAGRVALSSLDTSNNSGNPLTGGYIISIDKGANGWYSSYPTPHASTIIRFNHVYPKITDITLPQQNYIEAYVDSFENALHAPNLQDTALGWRKYAEESTFIDYFILNELSRNVDGYRISTYFHKDRASKGGKLKAGPVWDYDIAFRNANYCDATDTSGWAYRFNYVCGNDPNPVNDWWNIFMTDTTFKKSLYCRWTALRSTTLDTTHIFSLVDSIAAWTASARSRHFTRWPVLGQYVWPNPAPIQATYEDEIRAMKNWMVSRMSWLDANITPTGNCAPLAVTELNRDPLSIHLFPNPANEKLHVQVSANKPELLAISVLDLTGRKVSATTLHLDAGTTILPVDCSTWVSGFYILEFTRESGNRLARKIVKR